MTVRSLPCLFLALLLLHGTPVQGQLTDEQRVAVAERLREATVTVQAGRSSGSGFVVPPGRIIVTNAHVASGARHSGRLTVRFNGGRTAPAVLLAYDPHHDLAVAAVEGDVPVEPLPLGESDSVKVGQTVLAFGSPFGLEGTLTQGIVSARRDLGAIGNGRVKGVIQTDAPINPGNSGGPLVNTRGEVVGVNTAILSRGGGSNGIGFAVPVSYVKALLEQVQRERGQPRQAELQRRPRVDERARRTPRRRPRGASGVWLGVYGEDFRGRGYAGVQVHKVVPGSPAEHAGLLGRSDRPPAFIRQLRIPWTGHIILALDSHPVRSMRELQHRLRGHRPGEQAVVTVTVGPGIVTGETIVTLGAVAEQ